MLLFFSTMLIACINHPKKSFIFTSFSLGAPFFSFIHIKWFKVHILWLLSTSLLNRINSRFFHVWKCMFKLLRSIPKLTIQCQIPSLLKDGFKKSKKYKNSYTGQIDRNWLNCNLVLLIAEFNQSKFLKKIIY